MTGFQITFGPDTMTAIPSDRLVTIFGGSGFLGRPYHAGVVADRVVG
jgi:hypothetical protein